MSFLLAKLRPCLTGSYGGVDLLLDHGCADPTGSFDALSVIIDAVRGDGLGAVFVGGDGLRGKGGGVIELFVVCPVGAAVTRESVTDGRFGGGDRAYFASLDIL